MEETKPLKKIKNKKIEVRLDEELYQATMKKAKSEGKKPSDLVRFILELYTSV